MAKLLGALRKVRQTPQFAPVTDPNSEQDKNLSTHVASPTGEFTTPRTAPNVLRELRNPNDSSDPEGNDSTNTQSPANIFTGRNTSANPATQKVPNSPTSSFPNGSQQPSEVARLTAQYDKLSQPPSLKEQVAKAALSFAPTAIAGAFGGLAGASGAAQGANAGIAEQNRLQAQQKASLLEQVENARNREERKSEHELAARTAEQGHLERLEGIRLQNQSREDIQALKTQLGASANSQKNKLALRKLGLDENGDPIPREQLTPSEQSKLDLNDAVEELHKAQTEHAQAQAEFERTRSDPNSPAFKMAQQRLNLATDRLNLSKQQTESRLFGTNNGVPIPGALVTDSGQIVGSSYSQNVRPTGTQRSKADMATSADEQIQDIKSIMQKRPDIFGPAAGRTTDFTVWLGSEDPDAKRFLNARTIAGDHMAGTFGGRSEAALTALDNAIGQFKDNPTAAVAGLDQLNKANNIFIQRGTMRTVGSGNGPQPKGNKGKLDEAGARGYLLKAGGDKAKARALAAADGYSF